MSRRGFAGNVNEYDSPDHWQVPHDSAAERAILGSILLDNNLMRNALELGLEASDFYVRAHQFTWAAMVILHNGGSEIDPLLLSDVLRRDDRLEDVGGMSFISELTYGLPHFTNVGAYAKNVKDCSKLRDALKIQNLNTSLIINRGPKESADEILAQVEANTLEVVGAALRDNRVRSQEFIDVGQDEEEFKRTIIGYHEGVTDAIETPLKWLNDKLEGGGVQKQGLYVVAAPPKVGKTSLLLWFADFMARMDNPGGVISMEMRRQALIKRLFAQHTGIPFWMLRKGFHGPQYEAALKAAPKFFATLRDRLFIVDSISTTPQFRHAARRLVHGPKRAKWLAVDYLQLAAATANPDPHQRSLEVAAVSRDLKNLAQELDVPLIVISSLNQEGEREGRRPELTDLSWSGQMRYDAEAIWFLHNPGYKRGMTREERIAFDEQKIWDIDFILAAQRNGPTGEIRLRFVREFMQFLVPEPTQAPERGPLPAEPDFRNEVLTPLLNDASDDDDSWLLS